MLLNPETSLVEEVSPRGDNWQEVEFTITNPTSSPVSVNLFNVASPVRIPSTPSLLPPTSIITSTPVGLQPVGSAFCSVNNTIYVCNQVGNSISVIDGNSNLVTATITGGGLNAPQAISYNPVNNTMYVTNNSATVITLINCVTNATSTISIGLNSFQITYNFIDNTMYVGCSSSSIKVINCTSNTVSATITVPLVGTANDLAFNPYTNFIFFTESSAGLYPIDCSTNTVGTVIVCGTNPFFLTYSDTSNKLYVSNATSNDVTVLDGTTYAIITTIPVGLAPNCIVFDSVDNFVYVGNFTSNSLSAIQCSTDTVVATAIGFTTPSGIGYNSQNNSLYVSSLTLNTVTVVAPIQTLYISSPNFDYNQFVMDCGVNPKVVKQIVLSTTTSQLNNNVQIQKKDMYGNYYIDWKYPNIEVNKFMNQNTIVELNFKKSDLILDVYTSFQQYVVNANTSLIMLLYYKEAIAAEKLNRNGRATLGTCIDMRISNCNPDASDKTGDELKDFGESVITIEDVLKDK